MEKKKGRCFHSTVYKIAVLESAEKQWSKNFQTLLNSSIIKEVTRGIATLKQTLTNGEE